MNQLEREHDGKAPFRGIVAEHLRRAGDSLQDCVAVRVEASPGAGGVLRLVQEDAQRLA
jgi:hypothetical protein